MAEKKKVEKKPKSDGWVKVTPEEHTLHCKKGRVVGCKKAGKETFLLLKPQEGKE